MSVREFDEGSAVSGTVVEGVPALGLGRPKPAGYEPVCMKPVGDLAVQGRWVDLDGWWRVRLWEAWDVFKWVGVNVAGGVLGLLWKGLRPAGALPAGDRQTLSFTFNGFSGEPRVVVCVLGDENRVRVEGGASAAGFDEIDGRNR
jgi:hypothetical protein